MEKIKENLTKPISFKALASDLFFFLISPLLSLIIRTRRLDVFIYFHSFILALVIFSVVVKPAVNLFFGLYKARHEKMNREKLKKLVLAGTISAVLVSAIMLFMDKLGLLDHFSWTVIFIDWVLSLLLTAGMRTGIAYFLESERLQNKDEKETEKRNRKIFSLNSFLIVIVFIYCSLYLIFGGVISLKDGFGWDGDIYKIITQSLSANFLLERNLDSYRIQRILPSCIVNIGLRLFNLPLTDANILVAFRILNASLILLSVYIYTKISDLLNFSNPGKVLGFLALFLNFAVTKQFFYYTVLTDTMAFTLGLLLFYYYLKDNPRNMLATTIAGAFTWPLFIYYGLILYIFPAKRDHPIQKEQKLTFFIYVLIFFLLLAVFIWLYFFQDIKLDRKIQIEEEFVIPSILLSSLFLSSGLYVLLNQFQFSNIKDILSSIQIRRVAIGILTYILLRSIFGYLSSNEAPALTTIGFAKATLLRSIERPMIFSIAHLAYYGPVTILTIIFWKDFCRIATKYGIGLVLLVTLTLIMSVNSASRAILSAFPFIVILTIAALDSCQWSFWFYWIFFVFSFISSKIWLPLGNIELTGYYNDFPFQWYFMNYGPSISTKMYQIQGGIALFMGAILFLLTRKKKRKSPELV